MTNASHSDQQPNDNTTNGNSRHIAWQRLWNLHEILCSFWIKIFHWLALTFAGINLSHGIITAIATALLVFVAWKTDETLNKTVISANRAWVGPRVASMVGEPKVGSPIEINIEYQNTGREPAAAFRYFVEPFTITQDDDRDGTVSRKLQRSIQSCQGTKTWPGGSVIYPTGSSGFGGGGYTLFTRTSDDFVDEDVVKGNRLIVIHGCFLYRTFDAPKHSYFCYFYRQGFSKIQSFHICESGHQAN